LFVIPEGNLRFFWGNIRSSRLDQNFLTSFIERSHGLREIARLMTNCGPSAHRSDLLCKKIHLFQLQAILPAVPRRAASGQNGLSQAKRRTARTVAPRSPPQTRPVCVQPAQGV
jgi:hypothetical protein